MTNNAGTSALRPSYAIDARTAGYAVNDGRFVAQRIAPTVWSSIGTLQRLGTSTVLGVFDTREEAEAATARDLAVWETENHAVEAVR